MDRINVELHVRDRVVRIQQRQETELLPRTIELSFALWKQITVSVLQAEIKVETDFLKDQQAKDVGIIHA